MIEIPEFDTPQQLPAMFLWSKAAGPVGKIESKNDIYQAVIKLKPWYSTVPAAWVRSIHMLYFAVDRNYQGNFIFKTQVENEQLSPDIPGITG